MAPSCSAGETVCKGAAALKCLTLPLGVNWRCPAALLPGMCTEDRTQGLKPQLHTTIHSCTVYDSLGVHPQMTAYTQREILIHRDGGDLSIPQDITHPGRGWDSAARRDGGEPWKHWFSAVSETQSKREHKGSTRVNHLDEVNAETESIREVSGCGGCLGRGRSGELLLNGCRIGEHILELDGVVIPQHR